MVEENEKIEVMVTFGTRPEAIKLAPVIKELESCTDEFETNVVVTAQHRQMLDQVLEIFDIKPDSDLNIMTENQGLAELSARCLHRLDAVIKEINPHVVLIQGDTTTVLMAALACYYNKVMVGHVEAGLRTLDKYSPYPEEINRRMVSHLADFNFAPTEWSAQNLLKEGIREESIHITGNTIVDALEIILSKPGSFSVDNPRIQEFIRGHPKFILVTAHRRESFGQPLEDMFKAMLDILTHNNGLGIIYPVHPNPNVRSKADSILRGYPDILLTEPLDYLSFLYIMKSCYLILTDSGGIQEEAPSLKKPVLIMREKTERPEGIRAGTSRLVGTNRERIVSEVSALINSQSAYANMTTDQNPFGDGKAASRIVNVLAAYFGQAMKR